MKKLFTLLLIIGNYISFSQPNRLFEENPIKDGKIEFEKIISFDSTFSKDIVFTKLKTVLIKNTNYKVQKIDEDKESGSISTNINYTFDSKPGIAQLSFPSTTLVQIDVRDNKYRIRLSNHSYSMIIMSSKVTATIEEIYLAEFQKHGKGKWKESKSIYIPWKQKIIQIIDNIDSQLKSELKDSF